MLRVSDKRRHPGASFAHHGQTRHGNEITGQLHFESGEIAESLPYLRRASELLPREPLIMTALGHALVAIALIGVGLMMIWKIAV